MATSSVTSLLLLDTDPQPLVAAVLNADATATTYLLNCKPGTDSNDCGTYNESLTLGPWAQKTPAPGAPRTGVYDLHVEIEGYTVSVHCAMSGTTAQECTSINVGGNNDGTPTVTLTSPGTSLLDFAYQPVTITSGLDKLAAVSSQTTTAPATDATTTTAGTTATTATSTSAPTATGNSANAVGFQSAPTVALLSLVVAWLLK